jgi:SpoVK/Ycf46/Vps4 family AAA+-type ATPase
LKPPRSKDRKIENPIEKLRNLGVQVINSKEEEDNTTTVNNNNNNNNKKHQQLTWDHLAGYDDIKRQMEDTIINSFLHADIYDKVAKNTRLDFESNRPTAVLLAGPPGVGKTLTARILASKCGVPLVVLKLDNILSKWYGESENKLTEIFKICENELLDGVVIFIDEVDALVGSRDKGDMHEATRRLLSVILQKLEGFHGKCNSLIICASNRAQDLDSALISRFDLIIKYHMPDFSTRQAIIKRYAKQFNNKENALQQLAENSSNLSCRDIKECCEDVERKWASKIVKKEISSNDLTPPLVEYIKSFQSRQLSMSLYNKNVIIDTDRLAAADSGSGGGGLKV